MGWNFTEGEPITPDLSALTLLGGGDSFEAWLAFDEITYGAVVVKVLRSELVEDRSSRAVLLREVEALAAVNHPVVVRGLRHDVVGPRPHVVLEHIDGPRLSTLIRRYGPLEESQYLPLAIDVAAALHYLRQIDHVHLDIKPSNLIMGSPARLIDLSAARTADAAAVLDHPVGTDAYMAPEQARPAESARPSPASDVWGLGATLFHAIAGHRPFAEGDPDAVSIEARCPQLVSAPRDLPGRVPAAVAKLVRAALERDPRDRPLPAELVDGLQPVLEDQPRSRLAGGFRLRS